MGVFDPDRYESHTFGMNLYYEIPGFPVYTNFYTGFGMHKVNKLKYEPIFRVAGRLGVKLSKNLRLEGYVERYDDDINSKGGYGLTQGGAEIRYHF